MNYYISDCHFGHDNIIKYDGRPFEDAKEMNEHIINSWNSVVKENDTVYHLGDFAWLNEDGWANIINRLNGKIVFIKGNHDHANLVDVKDKLNDKEKISGYYDYYELRDGMFNLILCHYPITCYKKSYKDNWIMLYGHVHITKEWEQMKDIVKKLRNEHTDKSDNRGQLIHVGSMLPYVNYTPKTISQLVKLMDKNEDII